MTSKCTSSEAYAVPAAMIGQDTSPQARDIVNTMVQGFIKDNWENKKPTGKIPFCPPLLIDSYSISIYTLDGSEPQVNVWRAVPFRDDPARWAGCHEYVAEKATGWFLFDFARRWKQAELDMKAYRTPAKIKFDSKRFKRPDGTDGIIIVFEDATERNSVQMLNPRVMNKGDADYMNFFMLGEYAKPGDIVVDGMARRNPITSRTMAGHGFGGVGSSRLDGVIRSEWLRDKHIPTALSMSTVPISFGPEAVFRRPATVVEHPKGTDRNQHGIDSTGTYPMGPGPYAVPHGSRFYLTISEEELTRRLNKRGLVGAYRDSVATVMRALMVFGWVVDETGHYVSGFEIQSRNTGEAAADYAMAGLTEAKHFHELLKDMIQPGDVALLKEFPDVLG